MVTKKETSDQDFEALLEKYDYKFQKGDLVKGIVCGFDSQGVLVDIGLKQLPLFLLMKLLIKAKILKINSKKVMRVNSLSSEKKMKMENSYYLRKKSILLMLGKNLKKQKVPLRHLHLSARSPVWTMYANEVPALPAMAEHLS